MALSEEDNVLICGGCGYIGSFVTREFASKFKTVVVLDDLSHGHKKSIEGLPVTFYQGRVHDNDLLAEIFTTHKISLVVHLCSSISVEESVRQPLEYYRNNVDGFLSLCEAMRDFKVLKLIFSSTCSVFGTPQTLPVAEECEYAPQSPYAETKQVCEMLIKWMSKVYDMKCITFRYFNVAGGDFDGALGEDHRVESHLIPIVLQVALNQRDKISVFGNDYPTKDGTCVRDYIHVLDIAHAHTCAYEYIQKGGETSDFNLGTGRGYSVLEVIESCRKVTGHSIPSEIKERREGDLTEIYSASAKANNILGWIPKYPELDDIISSAWAWHSKHPSGYQD